MLSLAQHLREHDHEVVCVYRYARSKYSRTLDDLREFPLRCFDYTREFDGGFADFLHKSEFDTVYAHSGTAGFLLRHLGYATVEAVAVNVGSSSNLSRISAFCENPSVRLVTCVSELITREVKRLLDDRYHWKVKTVYSGTDFSAFKPMPKSQFIMQEFDLKGKFVVGFVAHIRHYKRLDIFLDAARQLNREMSDITFLIVGKVHEDNVDLASSILERPIRRIGGAYHLGNVIFTDIRSDVPRILSTFDVSVNCSDSYEGITGAIRESLAMQIPVICTDVGGNSEIVVDGETGFLIPAGDAALLAERISFVARNYQQAKRLAISGSFHVQRFSDMVRNRRLMKLLTGIT